MSDNISKLIEAVKIKTEKGLAEWTATSSSTEFQLSFNKGRITTDYYRSDNEQGNSVIIVEIRIYNDRGDEIYVQATSASQNRELFDKLREFYFAARSSYYKVSETIESLLEEANAPGILGNPAPF